MPYILKNIGGVYSCSCPAWRNQSLPIERRTCKHLRQFRGEQAEQARVGSAPATAKTSTTTREAPKLLLAQTWDATAAVAGWWLSEKLDGVRALWDGRQFFSRQGNVFHAPAWFIASLPKVSLDGELWLARKAFQRTVSIVRRHDEPDIWSEVRFLVFDAPTIAEPFEKRLAYLADCFAEHRPEYAKLLAHERCRGVESGWFQPSGWLPRPAPAISQTGGDETDISKGAPFMIEVTRSLVRQLRAVFRRGRIVKTHASVNQPVIFRTGSDGLRVQAFLDQVAVEYHQPGQFDAEVLVVSHDLLAASEGRTDDVVTLESRVGGGVLASWSDRGIPQILEFGPTVGSDASKNIPRPPELFERNSGELSVALQAATAVIQRERIRYALDCLQLRGREGKIVATDGRQVLVQGGFRFPWTDDLLIPASQVFASHELSPDQPVGVGIIEDWIAFRTGPWTIWLRIDREGRFPKIDDLIRNPDAAIARLSIEALDAEFLGHSLMRLPTDDAMNRPITLDLNGQVLVRAKGAEQTRAIELVLSRSTLQGENLSVNSDREFLARAVKLGFREICFFGPTAPALCDDGRRQYLWALLNSDGIMPTSEDAIRIESSQHLTTKQISHPKLKRRRLNVTQTINESTNLPSTPDARRTPTKPVPLESSNSPIGQAIALRTALRETLAQTNELIRALKREKRQSRLVASTLASLKQLQKVA